MALLRYLQLGDRLPDPTGAFFVFSTITGNNSSEPRSHQQWEKETRAIVQAVQKPMFMLNQANTAVIMMRLQQTFTLFLACNWSNLIRRRLLFKNVRGSPQELMSAAKLLVTQTTKLLLDEQIKHEKFTTWKFPDIQYNIIICMYMCSLTIEPAVTNESTGNHRLPTHPPDWSAVITRASKAVSS